MTMRKGRVRDGGIYALSPTTVLALFYLICILAGAALLKLPFAQTTAFGWSDALFTSVSAVTVTGLSVIDTSSALTGFGQAVLLVLIQLGGLGLMAFAVGLLQFLGLNVGIPQRMLLREEMNQSTYQDLRRILGYVFGIALMSQILGALILMTVFMPEYSLPQAAWYSIFHAVSAFNNAGFALFPDSLTRYASDPVINTVIPVLFITGGLGFIVLADLEDARSWRKLSLHSKIMLTGTAVLVFGGWAGVAVLEWQNPATLGGMEGVGSKLQAAWFQAVTPRTAGFNSVDMADLHDSTTLLTMAFMVIGGGPTSTAGGLKVTTIFVWLIATIAFFRRSTRMHTFGRSIKHEDVFKVMALGTLTMLLLMTGTFIILITHDGEFLDLAFEVVSAFGTVGLSRGITGDLDGLGRAVIMVMMFLGRVGPLTLGYVLATRGAPRIRYPEERLYLG